MKEQGIIIGKLKKRSYIIIKYIINFIMSILVYKVLSNSMKDLSFFQDNEFNAFMLMKVALIVMIIIEFLFEISFDGTRQIIYVDDNVLKYCSVEGLISKFQQFLNILLDKEQHYDINIQLNDIDRITLVYSDIYMSWSKKGHSIILNILLRDGTMVKLQPDNLYFEKKNFLVGIEYLESHNVCIEDPYNLKIALKDNTMRFSEYIDKMRKDNES